MHQPQEWAVVLAGGDGTRLRPLTRLIAEEGRPKQFCKLCGETSLLAQTRSRLAFAFAPDRTVFTVVQAHERFYSDELKSIPTSRLVAQPSNKGTTAAIISSLLRVIRLAGDPVIGFFPTDHHYARELRFVATVRLALKAVRFRPENIILLGAAADYPEVEYGWIEPGERLDCALTKSLHRVGRFWEKPPLHFARKLHESECLWNTFVMIGRASAFLKILKASVPGLLLDLLTDGEAAYAGITPGDFSQQVLSVSSRQLDVLRMKNTGWSDLGTPERVRSAVAHAEFDLQRRGAASCANLQEVATPTHSGK